MLNVLVAMGLMIAVSGGLIRTRPLDVRPAESPVTYRMLTAVLFVLGAASYGARQLLPRVTVRAEPARRPGVFFWSHVGPALVAALAVPLGLYCGWFVDPRLGAVSPFWVVPLALGFLAVPRRRELEVFETSPWGAGAPGQ